MIISRIEFNRLEYALTHPNTGAAKEALEFLQKQVDKTDEHYQKQRTKRLERQGIFFNELVNILAAHPQTNFTPTDLCYAIPNFVERDITVQKISYFFHAMELLTEYACEPEKDWHLSFDPNWLVVTRIRQPNAVKISWGTPLRDFRERRRA